MANLASWNGHRFRVNSKYVYIFKSLTIKASSETEDKTKSSQKYVSRKNSKPYEISLTIQLDARLGISDLKTEALKIANEAFSGSSDYFYISGTKVVNCKFMLTEADIEEIELMPNGTWLSCSVKCTWKQCELVTAEGTANAETKSSGSHKSSSKKSGKSAKTTTKIDQYSGTSSNRKIDQYSGTSSNKAIDVAKLTRAAQSASAKKNTTNKTTNAKYVLSLLNKK